MLRGRAEGKEEDMTLLHSEENVNIIDVTLLLKPRNEVNFGINGLKKVAKLIFYCSYICCSLRCTVRT